jgi:UDP-N-acetylmuramate dehydrogenase
MITIKENILLAPYTGLKVGGPATLFVAVRTIQELIEALDYAHAQKLEYFVLGSGTNLLITDKGFAGLVIKDEIKLLEYQNDLITAGCGLTLPEIHLFGHRHGRIGFEKMATVPGTLGGALYSNAHYLDDLISNYVVSVDVYDSSQAGRIQTIAKDALAFAYDTSLIKTQNLVAVSACLKLPEGDTTESKGYYLELIKKRGASQPYGTITAGCIFQNVPKTDDLALVNAPGHHGISAGWLIEQAGLKGVKIGGAEVSPKHCNFIVNTGQASAQDILDLIALVKEKVYTKFNVTLELEIKVLN